MILKHDIRIFLLFFLLSIFFNITLISSLFSNEIWIIPETIPFDTDKWFETMIGIYTWNSIYSEPSFGLDFLSFRLVFFIFGFIFSIPKMVIIERVFIHTMTFFGMFILSRDYLSRYYLDKKNLILSPFLAGVLYGINPSFMIGDSYWITTEFAFASFPWIIWSLNKAILDKNLKYSILCSLLIATNIDEHFIWLGFPIFIVIYSTFLFMKSIKENRTDFSIILSSILVIIISFSMIAYKLILRLKMISPYNLSVTKAGVDVPWMYATLFNMSRASTHMSLPNIYDDASIFSFLNQLMFLTVLIPILALLSVLRKNWIVIFYGILALLSILPFYLGSPFKALHYWVFFNVPFGPILRTWRVPDAFIALSLSIMIGFSLYHVFRKLPNKKYVISVFILITFLFAIYSWPLLTGDINGRVKPVKIPEEYIRSYSFLLNQSNNSRAILIPEFTYSNEFKLYWSPNAITDKYPMSVPIRTIRPYNIYSHFYDFSLSQFYSSLLIEGEDDILSYWLSFGDIKYIVIHNDIPRLKLYTEDYIESLNNSNYFRLIYNDNLIYIYENLRETKEKKIKTESNIILVDGGYRAIKKLYHNLDISRYEFIFIDQKFPIMLMDSFEIILTDKPMYQLINNIIYSEILDKYPNYIFYPYDYVTEHDPKNKWSRSSYIDPHQQVWHPYVNWPDYAWDFDYMKGLALTIESNDTIKIPLDIWSPEEYILAVRYLANERGGKINVNIDNYIFDLSTLDEYNGFLWDVREVSLSKGKRYIFVKNINGFNTISSIYVFPKRKYNDMSNNISNYLSYKQIINLNINNNIIENLSFEKLDNWKMDQMSINKFRILQDKSIFPNSTYSLKVYTDAKDGKWSWIRSGWINITEGDYIFISSIKAENVSASHIALEVYDDRRNKIFQLTQIPSAQYGNFEWKIYKRTFTIPNNVTKIRIVLNAGSANENGTLAMTWFDNLKLMSLKLEDTSFKLEEDDKNNDGCIIQNINMINPTLYKTKIYCERPFMISLSETYDPSWIVKIDNIDDTVEYINSIPLNSIINGFLVNRTGNLDITIEYKLQKWYYIGTTISIITLIICIGYLIYDWRKKKNN